MPTHYCYLTYVDKLKDFDYLWKRQCLNSNDCGHKTVIEKTSKRLQTMNTPGVSTWSLSSCSRRRRTWRVLIMSAWSFTWPLNRRVFLCHTYLDIRRLLRVSFIWGVHADSSSCRHHIARWMAPLLLPVWSTTLRWLINRRKRDTGRAVDRRAALQLQILRFHYG